jgi:hypothetical protein
MVDATIKTSPRTIRLKGIGHRVERPTNTTITPGMLVMLDSSDRLVPCTRAKQTACMFAVENELFGKGIDDNYVTGDYVQAEHFAGGDWVLALLPANATAVVEGDLLVSNGDGTLVRAGSDYDAVLAVATQAVDNSAGGSAARIMVAMI